jgi:hypothetical protein
MEEKSVDTFSKLKAHGVPIGNRSKCLTENTDSGRSYGSLSGGVIRSIMASGLSQLKVRVAAFARTRVSHAQPCCPTRNQNGDDALVRCTDLLVAADPADEVGRFLGGAGVVLE